MKFIPIAMLFAMIGYSESLKLNTETLSHKPHLSYTVPSYNAHGDHMAAHLHKQHRQYTVPSYNAHGDHMASGPMAPKMAPGDIPGTGSMPQGYGGQGAPSQGNGPMNPGQGQAPGMGPSPPNFTTSSDAPGYPDY